MHNGMCEGGGEGGEGQRANRLLPLMPVLTLHFLLLLSSGKR